MSLQYLFDPNKQFQSRNGVNAVNGFLRVYLNGTDDRATTYRNFDGGLNEPDIVLDTDGRAVVIVDDTKTYRIEVYNRIGGLMWTVSNYKARGGSGGGTGTPVSVEGTVGEIDVDENTEGGVKHFVIGLASTIKNAIATLTMAVNGVANALNGKKDKQTPVNVSGATTKTLVGISQDSDGVMTPEFDDIAFPDWTSAINAAVATCEKLENKKTTITGYESSNTYYPTIKAVVNFVNGMLQNLGGKLITDNGDPFASSSALPSTTPFHGVDIADKDYAYVQGVGTAERWSATVSGSSVAWVQEYAINIPVFTPSQQAIIDGDSSDMTATFSTASTRTNISTGEKLSVIFGKIAKWFGDLKAVAFSGSYNDLSNKPTIPTVNNGKLTIKQNGTSKGTFSANQLSNTEINVTDTTYESKSAVSGGTAESLVTTGEKYNWNTKQNAISDLAEIRSGAAAGASALQPSGNGSNVTSTFTAASSRTNISTGEKLSVIFGKIAKWFSDLKALAFKDNVSNSDISGTIADAHIASASTWNAKQNALPTTGTPSSTFAINVSGTARYSENVLPYYVSTDNDKSWLEVGTYKDNNSDEMYTGITFAVKFRSVDGHTQSGFVWISVGEWKSGGDYSNADIVCEYYTLGRRVKERPDSVKLYVNILGTSVTDGVKIYAYLSGYSNISLTPLNVNKGTYTSSMTYLDAEPATKKEVTYCNLLRSTYGTAIGSSSTPIYVDEYGIPKPCSSIPTPQTESWSGETSATATGTSNSGMIRFYASLDLSHGWGDGAHGFINYEVNCTSSSRKGESVCAINIIPGYTGGAQGISFLSYPFKFVENPPSYTNGTGVHVCGVGNCWTGSSRTIPSRLIVQVDTDASKFSAGDTLGISVRVTATKLL